MLHDIKPLFGRKLGATDGDIGQVKDFYFDDTTWAIRYLVADTGSWLPGRQVLISPHAFGDHVFAKPDTDADVLHVKLTRKQIEDSPSIETHRPVSRQQEVEYYRYYGWPAYWQDGGIWSGAGIAAVPPPAMPDSRPHHGHNQRDDVHLRSMKAVTGYQIHTTDGTIGAVSGFMVHGSGWAIRELIVETGHWYAGKPIHIRIKNVSRVSYDDASVFVDLSMEDLKRTATNEIALPTALPL